MSRDASAAPPDRPAAAAASARWTSAFALTFGIVLTLVVSGYQFGRGNHTVYLLDGLRSVRPELLTRDWFVTQTLQYHAVFSRLTDWLMRLHLLESGFLAGYLAIVVLWHFAWRRLVLELGGDDHVYLISVLLFYLSAAGISVGVFQFLQDGCFLPSNVANVAMLWGIARWIGGRRAASGIWLGVAGFFHVNYAVIAVGLWGSLVGWQMLDRWRAHRAGTPAEPGAKGSRRDPVLWLASAAVLIPSLFNIALALPDELRHGGTMPMGEFVRVYVRFRHTHHFDPLHWPAVLWLSFLWSIPLAIGAARWKAYPGFENARRETIRVFLLISALLVIAFLFAGVWFINEPLVQLCFWRFGIYIKLLSCVGTAWLTCDGRIISHRALRSLLQLVAAGTITGYAAFLLAHGLTYRGPIWQSAWDHRIAIGIVVAMTALPALDQSLGTAHRERLFHGFATIAMLLVPILGWNRWLGVGMTPEPDDSEYRQVCEWARDPAHTPVDAIFVVPPQETDFRLYGQRAIVVNFKHVPQLSGEIIEWKKRLLDVLGKDDITGFPHDYSRLLAALGAVYEQRPAAELYAVAKKYDARYLVVDHPFGAEYDSLIAFHRANNRYFVYDCVQPSTQANP